MKLFPGFSLYQVTKGWLHPSLRSSPLHIPPSPGWEGLPSALESVVLLLTFINPTFTNSSLIKLFSNNPVWKFHLFSARTLIHIQPHGLFWGSHEMINVKCLAHYKYSICVDYHCHYQYWCYYLIWGPMLMSSTLSEYVQETEKFRILEIFY